MLWAGGQINRFVGWNGNNDRLLKVEKTKETKEVIDI